MNTKKTIRKILFVGMWLAIGSGMLMLLIAAIGRQKRDTCKDYVISIKGAEAGELFLDQSDVVKLVKAASKGNIKGQPKTAFNLWKIEQLLEDNVWVKDAQLYFDNHEVLHIKIDERQPVARIFTAGGRSFYIDNSEQLMQLSDKVSARLPVFTGFPDKKKLGMKDSFLLRDINTMAQFISKHPFWSSQVEQVDIVASGVEAWEFEMIPLVGNHIVKLGDGKNIDQKLNRLFIFYKEVLSKTGFDKYKTVDVRYAGQVVGAKSENPKVDQAQLRKNVETLLRQIKEAEMLSDAEANNARIEEKAKEKEMTAIARPEKIEGSNQPVPAEPPVKEVKPAGDNKSPKAVMKKREG